MAGVAAVAKWPNGRSSLGEWQCFNKENGEPSYFLIEY